MTDKKAFKKQLANVLLDAGFLLKVNSWRASGEEVVVVVEINKSPYDEQHYLNIGFWINRLGSFAGQKYNQCHLYFRLEGLFPLRRTLILNSLYLSKTGGLEPNQDFFSFVSSEVIPFVKASMTLSDLARAFRDGLLADGLLLREARDLLKSE